MNTNQQLSYSKQNLISMKSIFFLFCMTFFVYGSSMAQNDRFIYFNGGHISTTDDTTICVDDTPDPIDVNLYGAFGFHKKWIITDDQNTVLAFPEGPTFDLNGAGPGICRIWHISYFFVSNLNPGTNLDMLNGWYDLSNYIEITRNQPEGGTLEGGPFEFMVGDGIADNIEDEAITLTGNVGSNSQWVVTDSDGNILGLPSSPYVVNFDGAGTGTCLIWHLSFEDGIEGAAMGSNAADLKGCYNLSNPIEVVRIPAVNGGTLEGGPFEFCVGDDYADNIDDGAISLTGNVGSNSQWVVTDSEGNILGLPPSPYVVNFDGAGAGTCLVWHLSFEDGLEGAVMGNNALTDLVGTYDLSNSIEVVRNQPEGGTLEGGPFEFMVGDGIADNIEDGAITLTGNVGSNSQWVVTDSDGNILGLPPSPYVVNFDGAGTGTCLIWHLSFEDGLEGAAMGSNAADLKGCYNLSNPIEVVRIPAVNGGTLEGGPFEFCVGDDYADNIDDGAISLTGNVGTNSQWVVTDSEGNILGLPPSPYVVNFDGAGAGTCLIWHLSFEDGLEGAVMGNNAMTDLVGTYDLSNSIEVVRNQPEGGTLEGGPFEFMVGDGIADNIEDEAITLTGNVGSNSQWVVTDSDGNILGLPSSPYVVNFDGAGTGTCLIWHLSFEDGIEGAAMGSNAADLKGCYNLSNPIEVVRIPAVNGGTLEGGPFEFCVGDDYADNIDDGAISLTGNVGSNSQWVVTDSEGNILGLPPSPYVVNFDGAGAGTCLVWHLSFEDGLEGAVMGNNAMTDLVGTYDLSNSIEVVRNQPEGGTLEGGPFEFMVGDGIADNIEDGAITLTGNSGANSQWVVTDSDGNILGLPPSPYVVDFDGAGTGTCLIWHLSFEDGLEGATMGNNAADLKGCYDLSNPIEVYRYEKDECAVEGGKLISKNHFVFCVGDDEPDYVDGLELEGNSGTNSQWVVTDLQGTILGLPESPEQVNFDGAGVGVCLIWHLSFGSEFEGAAMGNNAFTDLKGCYSLSNPIPVFRFSSDGYLCELFSYTFRKSEIEIGMYPNPAKTDVNLDLSNISGNVNVKVYNYASIEMYNRDIQVDVMRRKELTIDVSKFNSGFYLISVTDEKGEVIAVKRLIVE